MRKKVEICQQTCEKCKKMLERIETSEKCLSKMSKVIMWKDEKKMKNAKKGKKIHDKKNRNENVRT